MYKVFVYGSLLSGMGNHSLLAESKKLGISKSPRGFKMLDLGWFPGAIRSNDETSIYGEVYEVDDITLNRLDRLEGYNSGNPESGLYNRIEIDTKFGKALIYIYNNYYNRGKIVENGDWKKHYKTNKLCNYE